MEEYLNQTFDHLSAILNTDRISIQVINKQGHYVFKKWRNLSGRYRNAVKEIHLWDPSKNNFEPIFLQEIQNDPRFKSVKNILKSENIVSCSILPLVVNNKLLGSFCLYFSEKHNFGDWEKRLIVAASYAISLIIKKQDQKETSNETEILLLKKKNDEFFKTLETINNREENLNELFHTAKFGFWEFSIELEEFQCSDSLLYMIGFCKDRNVITLNELIHTIYPEDIILITSAISEMTDKIKPLEFVIRHIKPDKSLIYVHNKVKPKLKDGKVEKLVGTATDITEYKKTELEINEALLQEKEINRQNSQHILDHTHDFQKSLMDISSLLDMIKLDISGLNNYEATRYFNKTQSSINEIYNLLSSVKEKNINLLHYLNFSNGTYEGNAAKGTIRENHITKVKKSVNSSIENPGQILVGFGKVSKLIKTNEIEHITTLGNYTNVYLLNEGKITVRKLLKDWMKLLPEDRFLRIHRTCIINLDCLLEIEKWYNSSFRIKMRYSKSYFIASYRYSKLFRKRLKH